MEQLVTTLQTLPEELGILLTDPMSNLTAALLLYAVIGTLVAMVLVIAIMFLMGGDDDDEYEDEASPGDSTSSAALAVVRVEEAPAPPPAPKTPGQLAFSLAFVAGVLIAAWAVTGYSTSTDQVCLSCHAETAHTLTAGKTDPHADAPCVSCHEPGGMASRVTGNLAPRVLHFADASLSDASLVEEYGRITQSSCLSCHDMRDNGDVVDKERGLRMSHAEPIDASIECIECHTPVSGMVANHNAGMNSCLRCHDSTKASAECSTCHDRSAAQAARSEVTTAYAAVQVDEVRCGSCHDEKRQCDSCHGIRMPHTTEFKAYAHARAGAADFWYNGGKGCAKCHTPQRRPCQKCHSDLLGKGHQPSQAINHRNAVEMQCNGCHRGYAYTSGRNFCTDLCHTPAAIKESPY